MKLALPIVGLIAAVFAGLALLGPLTLPVAILAFVVLTAGVVVVLMREERRPPAVIQETPGRRPGLPEALRHVMATLPDPAIAVDVDGSVVLHNDQAAALFHGLRTGHNISGTIRAPVVLEALDVVLKTGEAAHVDFEQRVPLERRFEVYVAPLPKPEPGLDGHGHPAVMLLLRDLTQQERLDRMRADFVAYASHELRTPLASVLGFIETLQGAARDDANVREEFLELMRTQANRMARLIDDLLSLSRVELNAHVRPDSVVDLQQVVDHVLKYLAPLAEESGIDIQTAFQVTSAPVHGDRDELVQVVQNLVENAMKYGQSGGRVEVTIAPGPVSVDGDAQIDIRVRDFGPGISPEHLPRLTERFYRVDVAQSRAKGGTGLGLAIVKHIVNRHGGRLEIESEPGTGSEFIVRLPQAVNAGPAEP